MRRLIILAVAATLTLTACGTGAGDGGGGSTDAASPSQSATPTHAALPTPSATPTTTAGGGGADGEVSGDGFAVTDTVVTKVKLELYGAGLLNAQGQWIDSFSYGDVPKVVAAKLSDVFGVTPTTVPNAYDPQVIEEYSFGGLSMTHVQQTTSFMGRRFTFVVTAASISGIEIEGPNGWHVGSPAGPIEANYDSWHDAGVLWIYANLTPHDYGNQIYLQADDPYTTITSFSFPDGA